MYIELSKFLLKFSFYFNTNNKLKARLFTSFIIFFLIRLFKIIGDLLKKIQYNINDLDNMEQSIKYNLYDYFELIKNEIQSSAQTLIDQAIKYRDTLLNQIDYLKEQSTSYFNELFSQQGPLSDLRKKCNQKKHEWQSSIEKCSSSTNADENKINAIIREADKLNLKLNETRLFIQNSINSRKLVFNQAEPTYMDSKTSIIGQLGIYFFN